jgi:chemotaxis protein MotB
VMTVTSEGLRVELIEGSGSTFFESGSPAPSDAGRGLLACLAREIGKLPNKLTIEGHTDSRPFTARADYSNWELSSDRANAARRLMETLGMRGDQVSEVRGYADRNPRERTPPDDPSNRRVTIIIMSLTSAHAEASTTTEPARPARKS